MEVRTYAGASAFLDRAGAALEADEAANNLMLGICGQLARHPGRLKAAPCLKTVEHEGDLALAAVMTPPHSLVVCALGGDLAGAVERLVDDLAGEGRAVPGVLGPTEEARLGAERWAAATGQGVRLRQRQRVYELREVLLQPLPECGRLRQAGPADLELVTRWRHGFHAEIMVGAEPEDSRRAARSRVEAGDIYLWEDGQPVSMAMKNRPTRTGIGVSLVYTPPELRRRGYATACVAALSRLLLDEGRAFCALFADLANPTSNHIYQQIGYRPVCDYEEYAFFVHQT